VHTVDLYAQVHHYVAADGPPAVMTERESTTGWLPPRVDPLLE